MHRHFFFCVSFCFLAAYLSGCVLLTAVSEDAGGMRLWPLLLTLLALGGAGLGAFRWQKSKSPPSSQDTPSSSDKHPPTKTSPEPTQPTSVAQDNSKPPIDEHIEQVLDKAIQDYEKKVLAYFMIREAERRDSPNTLIKKLYEAYGEVYSLPYFQIPEELFSLKSNYVLVDEYLYAYLEKQGASPDRQKYPKPQIQKYTEQHVSSRAAAELDQFCRSLSQQ